MLCAPVIGSKGSECHGFDVAVKSCPTRSGLEGDASSSRCTCGLQHHCTGPGGQVEVRWMPTACVKATSPEDLCLADIEQWNRIVMSVQWISGMEW